MLEKESHSFKTTLLGLGSAQSERKKRKECIVPHLGVFRAVIQYSRCRVCIG